MVALLTVVAATLVVSDCGGSEDKVGAPGSKKIRGPAPGRLAKPREVRLPAARRAVS